MADAILWQILTAIESRLQEKISFTSEGSDQTKKIKREAIVIRKLTSLQSYQRDNELYERDEIKPGILITPPRRVIRPKDEGTNYRDDVYYNVLCQIIDGDGYHDDRHLRTYLKWQQQIAKHFNARPLTEVQGDEGCVNIVFATETDVIDDTLFITHEMFVAGVLLECSARENRVDD